MSNKKASPKKTEAKAEETKQPTPAELGVPVAGASLRKGVLMRCRDTLRECARDAINEELKAQQVCLDAGLKAKLTTTTDSQVDSLIGLADQLVKVAEVWTDKAHDKCTRVTNARDMSRQLRMLKAGELKAMSTAEREAAEAEAEAVEAQLKEMEAKLAAAKAKLGNAL